MKRWTPTARAAFARKMKLARARAHRRPRKKNPTPWKFRVVIKAVPIRGGSPLYFDGKTFSSNKSRRKYFTSIANGKAMALHQLKKHAVLRRAYRVTLNSV